MKDDLVQELSLKLVRSRVIEAFDPAKTGGSDAGLFFNFVHMTMRREIVNRINRDRRDAHGHLINYVDETPEEVKKQLHKAEVETATIPDHGTQEFRDFVEAHRPYLLDTLDMLLAGYTLPEIAEAYGVRASAIDYRRRHLRTLYRVMVAGRVPATVRRGRPPHMMTKKQ